MKLPKRHYRRWKPSEDYTLRKLAKQNTPTRIISLKLKRTVWAVYRRANRLGISLAPWNQSPDHRRVK